jgi:hypothetical protein
MDLEHILVLLTNLTLAVRGVEQAEDDPDGAMAEDGLTKGVNLKYLGILNAIHPADFDALRKMSIRPNTVLKLRTTRTT